MAAGAILKNPKIAISCQRFDRSPRNLAWWRNSTLMTHWRVPQLEICNFKNPRWRRPLCEKSKNHNILKTVWAIGTKFVTARILSLRKVSALKISNCYKSKTANDRHLEKSKNGHISATVWPIGTRFGMMTHIDPPNRISSWNFKLLKIQDGRRPPSWKIEKCTINKHKCKKTVVL